MRELLQSTRPLVPLSVVPLALVLALCACAATPTAEDSQRLEKLQRLYGANYMFEFEHPLYLRVTTRKSTKPDTQELEAIFTAFWLNDEGQRRSDTAFVYLNAYGNDGTWLLQLYWDPEQERIVAERRTEHY